MRPRLALSIGAVAFILSGLPFVLAPAQVMSAIGWPATPDQALVAARDAGVLLIGVGIIDWLARDAIGPPLRGVLWGNIFIRIAGGAVNLWELAIGLTPGTLGPTLVVALVLNIALIVMFALALRRA